jgi:5-methylcytosine-specific restriction endonuclease McrA
MIFQLQQSPTELNSQAYNNRSALAAALDEQAKLIGRTAHQFAVLEELNKEIANRFGGRTKPCVVNFDSALFSSQLKPEYQWAWATSGLQYWLGRNAQFAMEGKRPLISRYIIVPKVESISSPYWRNRLLESVTFNAHLGLWHGVIVCVVVVDPKKYPPEQWAKAFDLSVLTEAGIALVGQNFYRSNNAKLEAISGTDYGHRLRRLKTVLNSTEKHFWLWYDEATYAPNRLAGARWKVLRDLFYELSPKPFVCPSCATVTDFVLDHVLPIKEGFPQTLVNFEGMCGRCNSSKGSRKPRHNPFLIPEYIPDDLKTPLLERILKEAPPWLGSLARPKNVADAQRLSI